MAIRGLYEIKVEIDSFDEDLSHYAGDGSGWTPEAQIERQILINEHEEWHRQNRLGNV